MSSAVTINKELLNKKYAELTIKERIRQLYLDFQESEVMLTSSFATTSAYPLKMFSEVNPNQEVLFLDTGYLFKETLIYKEYLEKLYDLKVTYVRTESSKHEFTTKDETWKKDPDYCCIINKVEPLEAYKAKHRVWVSGLMKW